MLKVLGLFIKDFGGWLGKRWNLFYFTKTNVNTLKSILNCFTTLHKSNATDTNYFTTFFKRLMWLSIYQIIIGKQKCDINDSLD